MRLKAHHLAQTHARTITGKKKGVGDVLDAADVGLARGQLCAGVEPHHLAQTYARTITEEKKGVGDVLDTPRARLAFRKRRRAKLLRGE